MATDTQEEIKKLEEKLQQLKVAQIAELQNKLREAKSVVRDLEQEIENLSGRESHAKRKRISSAEVRERIQAVLRKAKEGLSQKEISEKSGINYQTTALFLRNNQQDFRRTGRFKGKRYFLR
jgi:hypothetical protein